ncbi:hypothetical protein EVAR_29008_1 [Eumeta japonica]|uniref:Uncharacterized protein n=1 Tax=Eumeta variegata TaxID=151549 RepID=A0A4C1W322_EUMVA|nr:hypothetical protein EVAR_29008_1 [Eumeta japonica]
MHIRFRYKARNLTGLIGMMNSGVTPEWVAPGAGRPHRPPLATPLRSYLIPTEQPRCTVLQRVPLHR